MKKTSTVSYKRRDSLFRAFALFMAFLLIFGITLNALAARWEDVINTFLRGTSFEATSSKLVASDSTGTDSEYYKSDYDSFEEYYEAGRELNQRIEAEGAVLLKNDNNALPLAKGASVSLFGFNSTQLVYGGTGSGEAKGSAYPTMKEALENEAAGLKVNPQLWDFYLGASSAPQMGSYPENVITSYGSYNDAAIVTIARGAGEGQDVSKSPNVLALTQADRDMLTSVKEKFDKVIVLLNTTNPMELGELVGDEYGVDAVLWVGPVGQYGMFGVADILVGNANPSGRLIDTYATSVFSAPATVSYGVNGLNQFSNFDGTNYTVYTEGIYIGYRYYETRYEDCVLGRGDASSNVGAFQSADGWNYAQEVTYPFGYGLSYTTFEQTLDQVEISSEGMITATVTVRNTGSVAGKSVVQLYGQQPYTQYDIENGIEKSAVELVGFTKTDNIPAGESQTVTVEIDKKYFSSYDSAVEQTYILEPGDYYLAIGDNAHDALNNILAQKGYTLDNSAMDAAGTGEKVYMWTESEFDAATYSRSNGTKITNQFDDADLNKYEENTVTYLSRSNWAATWPVPGQELVAAQSLIEKYSYHQETTDTDLSRFTFGESNGMMLATLIGADYDDPYWDELLNQLTVEELISIVAWNGRQANPTIGLVESAFADSPNGIGTDANSSYVQYKDLAVLYFPNGSVLASTWNHELAEEYGRMNGETGLYTANTGWFAPAVNLHRTPFSGRNFEYYGEDPVLSGEIAAEVVVGVQSKGVYVMVKHFALNDQESGRQGLSTFANEQTIRQIYLRAFEIPVVEGNAQGLMSAFNRIGPWWAGMCKGLLTDVLRNEWGFNGIVITDQYMANSFMDLSCAVLAGNTSVCNPTGDNGIAALMPYSNDAEVVAAVRESAHRILYVIANSNAMNGIDADMRIEIVTPWYRVMTIIWIASSAVLLAGALVLVIVNTVKLKKERAMIRKRTFGYWSLLVSALCGLISIIGYATFEGTAVSAFPVELLVLLTIAVVMDALLLIKPLPVLEFLPLMFYGLAFAVFCDTQSFFISNVFVGIDGNRFSMAFIACLAGTLLAMIFGGIACAVNTGKVKEGL